MAQASEKDQDPILALRDALPDLDWVTDEGRVARLSQDFSWFSPVLKRQLADRRAAIVVRPRTEDEILRLVSQCAKRRLPITLRGSGTGNYGQAIPLQGGVLLDMSAYNAFLWARDGVARAQAGIRLVDIDKACAAQSMELRCVPSTFRSATLGGLFGGGFGGVGSINYGPLACPGNLLAVRALTIEEQPQIVELRGVEALQMHHMWGTNGLALEIEVALAPVHDWMESIVSFNSFDQALEFCDVLARAPGILKKEVCFLADPVPSYLKQLALYLPQGCHAVIIATASSSLDAVLALVAQFQGTVTYQKTATEVAASNRTLLEFTWNHTTLHALREDKTFTYLQSAFTPGQHLEQVRHMEKMLAGEVLMHCEFIRNLDGMNTCTALQLVRFTTEQRLQEIMQIYRDNGVRINNPHVYIVEDGKAGGELAPGIIATKRRFDPHYLLNRGKVRAWSDADQPLAS